MNEVLGLGLGFPYPWCQVAEKSLFVRSFALLIQQRKLLPVVTLRFLESF